MCRKQTVWNKDELVSWGVKVRKLRLENYDYVNSAAPHLLVNIGLPRLTRNQLVLNEYTTVCKTPVETKNSNDEDPIQIIDIYLNSKDSLHCSMYRLVSFSRAPWDLVHRLAWDYTEWRVLLILSTWFTRNIKFFVLIYFLKFVYNPNH